MSLVRHAAAVLVLPFTVTVVVPAAAVLLRGEPYVRVEPVTAAVTGGVALLGLVLVVWTIGLFGTRGGGTLAPSAPTQRLVVSGPYRHVRNPMIMAVAWLLLAEVLVTHSGVIAAELALFVLANATYIPAREERGLLARFGDDYAVYARNVPRWLPRTTPWTGADDGVPRRAPDDLPMARLPIHEVRGLVVVHGLAMLALVASVGLGVAFQQTGWPPVAWVLGAFAATWALLDLRDAWTDALRDPPPDVVFGRMREDGKTFEIREEPGGRPVAGWRFVRRDNGAFVLMRKRLASRPLVKGVRPAGRPFRMAVSYEPRGKPDAAGWIRYPASAAWEEPPGEWRPVRA